MGKPLIVAWPLPLTVSLHCGLPAAVCAPAMVFCVSHSWRASSAWLVAVEVIPAVRCMTLSVRLSANGDSPVTAQAVSPTLERHGCNTDAAVMASERDAVVGMA